MYNIVSLNFKFNKKLNLINCFLGVINVLTTTPLWVVNSRLKMKGVNNNNIDSSITEDNQFNNLFGKYTN